MNARRFSWTRGGRWGALALSVLLGAVLIGCGDQQRRYEILSFFFDGVPDPSEAADASATRRKLATGQTVIIHKPYLDKQCQSCHAESDDVYTRTRVSNTRCVSCHESVTTRYAAMHGPVAGELCLTCHRGHQSSEEYLLRQPSPRLCVDCHERQTLGTNPPEHAQTKNNCLSCHSGHGGTDRRYLKVAIGAAATQPVQQGAEAK